MNSLVQHKSALDQAAIVCELDREGRITAEAYSAMQRLRDAGLLVIPVTGRPAGWCDHIARMWPVDGVVGENGAFYFRYDEAAKKMIRVYAQSPEVRRANSDRLWAIAHRVLNAAGKANGLLHINPYEVTMTDIQLPILVPGTYPAA